MRERVSGGTSRAEKQQIDARRTVDDREPDVDRRRALDRRAETPTLCRLPCSELCRYCPPTAPDQPRSRPGRIRLNVLMSAQESGPGFVEIVFEGRVLGRGEAALEYGEKRGVVLAR